MAVRKIRPEPTDEEKRQMYRASQARKSYPRFDRHGGYREACGELAEETGGNVDAIYEEWIDRTQARLYNGEREVEDAERLAMADTREAYEGTS